MYTTYAQAETELTTVATVANFVFQYDAYYVDADSMVSLFVDPATNQIGVSHECAPKLRKTFDSVSEAIAYAATIN